VVWRLSNVGQRQYPKNGGKIGREKSQFNIPQYINTKLDKTQKINAHLVILACMCSIIDVKDKNKTFILYFLKLSGTVNDQF
jgi:hypothetical protein